MNPEIETGFAFKLHMNDVYVEAFNNQTFNQDGNGSAILKIKNYNPPNLIFQRLPVKEKVINKEVNRIRKSYIIDTLTSVDTEESVKFGGKVIRIYEGVIYRENFKKSTFRKVLDKLFALRQNYKDENNDLMQSLVNLVMISLNGAQIRKYIIDSFCCKSEQWMKIEYNDDVLEHWKLPKLKRRWFTR